jgi:hypothetical protein
MTNGVRTDVAAAAGHLILASLLHAIGSSFTFQLPPATPICLFIATIKFNDVRTLVADARSGPNDLSPLEGNDQQ